MNLQNSKNETHKRLLTQRYKPTELNNLASYVLERQLRNIALGLFPLDFK